MTAPTNLSHKGNLNSSAISFRPPVLLGTTRSSFGHPTSSHTISRQLPLHPWCAANGLKDNAFPDDSLSLEVSLIRKVYCFPSFLFCLNCLLFYFLSALFLLFFIQIMSLKTNVNYCTNQRILFPRFSSQSENKKYKARQRLISHSRCSSLGFGRSSLSLSLVFLWHRSPRQDNLRYGRASLVSVTRYHSRLPVILCLFHSLVVLIGSWSLLSTRLSRLAIRKPRSHIFYF
jgi:hypothetical protein